MEGSRPIEGCDHRPHKEKEAKKKVYVNSFIGNKDEIA